MKTRSTLLILLAGIFILALSHFAASATGATPRRIEVTAKRFAYEPAEVTLKAGEPVILAVTSADVPHGIRFKELNLEARIAKGRTSELPFTPNQAGDFVGHCSVFCGVGHGSMTITLHVVK